MTIRIYADDAHEDLEEAVHSALLASGHHFEHYNTEPTATCARCHGVVHFAMDATEEPREHIALDSTMLGTCVAR